MTADIGIKTPLIVFKELVGGGYVVSVALVICAMVVFRNRQIPRSLKRLWLWLVVIPVLGPLCADYLFKHFVANRQTMFASPALVLFTSSALQSAGDSEFLGAAAARSALVLILFGIDVSSFLRPHENWDKATRIISSKLKSNKDACVIFVPSSSLRYYAFFDPDIPSSLCASPVSGQRGLILIAISPYGGPKEYERLKATLEGAARRHETIISATEPKVMSFE